MSATVNTSKYQQWANLAKQNGWSEQELASAFVTQSRQNGQSKQEIIQEYKQVLAEYDNLRNQPANVDSRSMGEKVADTMRQYGGAAARFGESIGDSLAANYTTKLQQEAQQQRLGQEQIIYDRIRQARQAGNEQEVQRLLGILNDPRYADTTDYQQQANDYRLGAQRAVQGAVGTGAMILGSGIPGANTVGGAALGGAIEGGIQGMAMSDADIINNQEYGQLLTDTAVGAGTGAVVAGGLKAGEKAIGNLRQAKQAKTGAKTAAQNTQSAVDDQISFDKLNRKQKKQLEREVHDFFNDNDISVSRQQGKRLKPQETVFEIDQQLASVGRSVKNMPVDELDEFTQLITGPDGATSRTTRDMIASIDRPISVTTKEGGKQVDTISRGIKEAMDNTTELYGDDVAAGRISKKVDQLLDRAKTDLNHYDAAKLYDVQKDFEQLAAKYRADSAKSLTGNMLADEKADIFQTGAREIAAKLDKVAVDDGIFTAGRDALAQQYREMGLTRLADQVANTKNISQLRSTSAPFVRMSQIIDEGRASMYSTFNRNTNQVNRLYNRMGGLPRTIADTVDFVSGGRASRAAGYAMEDLNESLRNNINQWFGNRQGWTQTVKDTAKQTKVKPNNVRKHIKQLGKVAVPVIAGESVTK